MKINNCPNLIYPQSSINLEIEDSFIKTLDTISNYYPYTPLLKSKLLTPDRFGFSYLAAQRLNLSSIPRSFCDWIHGWIWWDVEDYRDIQMDVNPQNITKVVNKRKFCELLIEAGVNNVFLGALPYAYVLNSKKYDAGLFPRLAKTLLCIPSHTSEVEKPKLKLSKYLDYIESIKGSFKTIAVCLFHLDYYDYSPLVLSRGFIPLMGAAPDCANSLFRTRSIFDSFEYVTTNCLGSHILYALAAGCKTSISGPFYCDPVDAYLDEVRKGTLKLDFIERYLYYFSLDYLQSSDYSDFLLDHPIQASVPNSTLQNLVNSELGIEHLYSNGELFDKLGWTLSGQVKGHLFGASRKIKRIFS